MTVQLGAKIRELRKKRGISQEVLAQYLGVTFQAVSKWENGTAMPDVPLIPALASFFGVSTDELFDYNRLEAEKKVDDENTTKLFVFSSTMMFDDSADQMVSGNNAKLFSSCMSSFADSSDNGSSIVIPVKEYDTAKITVSSMTVVLATVGLVILLPLVLLGAGIGIWAVRRKK